MTHTERLNGEFFYHIIVPNFAELAELGSTTRHRLRNEQVVENTPDTWKSQPDKTERLQLQKISSVPPQCQGFWTMKSTKQTTNYTTTTIFY